MFKLLRFHCVFASFFLKWKRLEDNFKFNTQSTWIEAKLITLKKSEFEMYGNNVG